MTVKELLHHMCSLCDNMPPPTKSFLYKITPDEKTSNGYITTQIPHSDLALYEAGIETFSLLSARQSNDISSLKQDLLNHKPPTRNRADSYETTPINIIGPQARPQVPEKYKGLVIPKDYENDPELYIAMLESMQDQPMGDFDQEGYDPLNQAFMEQNNKGHTKTPSTDNMSIKNNANGSFDGGCP